MKHLIARILAPISVAVLLFAGAAHAQYVQHTIQVNVPFEFTVGDKVFPAGDYSVVATAPNRLDLRNSEQRVVASLLTHSVQSLNPSSSTRLLFSTLSGGHALTQVWMQSESTGFELAQPKPASLLAKRHDHEPTGAGNK